TWDTTPSVTRDSRSGWGSNGSPSPCTASRTSACSTRATSGSFASSRGWDRRAGGRVVAAGALPRRASGGRAGRGPDLQGRQGRGDPAALGAPARGDRGPSGGGEGSSQGEQAVPCHGGHGLGAAPGRGG